MVNPMRKRFRNPCHPGEFEEQPLVGFRALNFTVIRATLAKHFSRKLIYLPHIQLSRYIASDAAGKGDA
jgi:hypothetical protein